MGLFSLVMNNGNYKKWVRYKMISGQNNDRTYKEAIYLEKAKKTNPGINPIDDPAEAIDFYMPLPDDVYKKWK